MQRRRTRSVSWLGGLALLGLSYDARAQTPPAEPPAAAPEAPAPEAPAEPAPEPPAAEAPPEAAPEAPAPQEPAGAPAAPAEATPADAPTQTEAPPADAEAPPAAAAVATPPAEPSPPATPPPASWGDKPAGPIDSGVEPPASGEAAPQAKRSRWRATRLAFEQSLTAQTLGVGQDYQSENPTYDWTLWFRPRYYFIDNDDWTYSVRGIFSIGQELTNSDETTRMREFDMGPLDSILQLRYDRVLYEKDAYSTRLGVGLPEVTLPTSKASRNNGRILGLGAGLVPSQLVPLMEGSWLQSFSISGLARYHHYFTNTEVPTSGEIEQQRTDLDGRPVTSDQLSASPFAKHETRFGFGTELAIHDRVVWASDFQWRPTWNYEVDDEAEVCLLTGCTGVDGVESPQSFEVVTVFASEVEAYAFDSVSFTLGYINIANQIGPDGQRRNMFYSPDARFYFTVNFYPSEVLDPGQAPKHVAKAREARPLAAF